MTHVTVSSKYQVVLPREIRERVPLHAGEKLAVVVKEGVISLLPDRPLASLRGFLRTMKIGAVREKQDRL